MLKLDVNMSICLKFLFGWTPHCGMSVRPTKENIEKSKFIQSILDLVIALMYL